MVATQVYDGTWEEIKQHELELSGKQLRVTVKSEGPSRRKPGSKAIERRIKALNAWFDLPRPAIDHVIDDTRGGIYGYAEDRG